MLARSLVIGIYKFAEKIDIDPAEDIRILVLLHKMGANEKPGQITRDEWKKGCEKLEADSIEKFKALLPSLDTGFMVDNEFREFYKVRSWSFAKKDLFIFK